MLRDWQPFRLGAEAPTCVAFFVPEAQRLHKDPLGFAASVASMTSSQPECKEKTFRFASCVDQDCS